MEIGNMEYHIVDFKVVVEANLDMERWAEWISASIQCKIVTLRGIAVVCCYL
jgi:hypothetical protein